MQKLIVLLGLVLGFNAQALVISCQGMLEHDDGSKVAFVVPNMDVSDSQLMSSSKLENKFQIENVIFLMTYEDAVYQQNLTLLLKNENSKGGSKFVYPIDLDQNTAYEVGTTIGDKEISIKCETKGN